MAATLGFPVASLFMALFAGIMMLFKMSSLEPPCSLNILMSAPAMKLFGFPDVKTTALIESSDSCARWREVSGKKVVQEQGEAGAEQRAVLQEEAKLLQHKLFPEEGLGCTV